MLRTRIDIGLRTETGLRELPIQLVEASRIEPELFGEGELVETGVEERRERDRPENLDAVFEIANAHVSPPGSTSRYAGMVCVTGLNEMDPSLLMTR